jgi:nicotinate phosphoribosyltransferase
VVAPLPQAQLVETFLTNQVHLQTVLASKAVRIVTAARGRAIVDFGLRRAHGADAGL